MCHRSSRLDFLLRVKLYCCSCRKSSSLLELFDSQFDDVTHNKGSHLGKSETVRWEESFFFFFCYELSTNEGRNHVTCNVAALSFCVKAEPCSTPLIPVLSLSAPCSRASRVGLVMYLHVIAAAITCSLSSTIAVWSRSSCSDWCCETLLFHHSFTCVIAVPA